jgi:hypothetical protein
MRAKDLQSDRARAQVRDLQASGIAPLVGKNDLESLEHSAFRWMRALASIR